MAGEFYTPQQVQGADFTGYSKGFKSSNAVGQAFEGAGDILGMAVQATDNYYQGTIKEEARVASEQLLNDYGNDAAVDAVGGLDSPATPKEIQQGADRLALLKQAQANGTLKESNFWAQAELISRQLKQRYPGYWEQIDGALSQQLGRKPALALHNELQQEREVAATKSDVERRQAFAAARSVGLVEPFIAEQKGKPMSTVEINTMVANRNSIKWNQESAVRNYNLKKARNAATEDDADLAMRTQIQTEFMTKTGDATSALFRNREEFDKWAREYQRQLKSGTGVDPQVMAQAKVAKDQLIQAGQDIANAIDLQYSDSLPDSKRKENIGILNRWLKDYTDQLEDGNITMGNINTTMLSAWKDYNASQFLLKNNAIQGYVATVDLFGQDVFLNYKTNHPERPVDSDIDAAITRSLEYKMYREGIPLTTVINEMQSQGIVDTNAYSQQVDNAVNGIVAEETPNTVKSNNISSLFGEKNLDFLNEAVPASERLPMFLRVTSPDVIKKMGKLYEEGRITSDDMKKVTNWVSKNAVQLIRDQSNEINLIPTNRKSISVSLNPKTHLIDKELFDFPFFGYEGDSNQTYKPEGNTLVGRYVSAWSEAYQQSAAATAVDNVNDIIRNVKPLMEVLGEDPATAVPLMLGQAGIKSFDEVQDKGLTGAEPAVKAVEEGVANASTYLWEGFKKLGQEGGLQSGKSVEGLKEIIKDLGWSIEETDNNIIIIPDDQTIEGLQGEQRILIPKGKQVNG